MLAASLGSGYRRDPESRRSHRRSRPAGGLRPVRRRVHDQHALITRLRLKVRVDPSGSGSDLPLSPQGEDNSRGPAPATLLHSGNSSSRILNGEGTPPWRPSPTRAHTCVNSPHT